MEFLKRLVTQFTYRIEPKPEGGFIAHASDPSVPPLEAATREELQQKIQANIMASLAQQFPGLKIPLQGQETKFNFHIERKPEGGFAIHSDDPNVQPVEGTQEQVESHFAEKLIALTQKFSPELRQALAQQGVSGDIKVFVDRKTFTAKAGSHKLSLSLGSNISPAGSIQAGNPSMDPPKLGDGTMPNANPGGMGYTITNAPITPERSSGGSIFMFLLTLLVLAALMYFFLYHR